ncbi:MULTISPECIES: DEAD/DEAH box helicase [Rhodopseudomonas]|uniref:DNA helicase n=1 Tax=Rhodopseudomonas palustris TaxID=1076 RepID=A0A0D7EUL6_RHOPL|nr:MULTISPECIES: DEAD/DEAH box helicase [Rhodopseudomonas]KIZ44529.1 DNA helicase [Rhodopseudomonas palustris]MDF3814334.1 DEAD/DEAH box helicase [Rhodopseudomonas sp. BAL398]WOK18030.1 DEAD/DEAH box helicase [Rhodopseudomonas sp. BAL398]
MPELDQDRLEIAEQLRREVAPEDTLTPIQARSFVRGLQTAWEVPIIQWGTAESRSQLYDARRLLDAAAIFRKVEGEASANAILCYRRAGELLEWLTRANDDLETFVPLELLAAASYQLGGLPAMSAALLGQVRLDSAGRRLYARFLRADFDGVIRTVTAFWRDHLDITDREAPGRLLGDDGEDKVSWYFTVELIRALGAIADALRRGDDQRLDRALAKLSALDKMAVRTLGDDASALVALLYQVAITYRDASIYTPVRALGALNPERASRLEAFARTQFSRKRGILWTSQRHGIARLLEESSFALCTPTGSGKTLVANLALVKELLLREEQDPAPLALYLVPSRALAGEVEAKLTGELGRDLIVTGLYGGSDWGVTDYWLDADRPTVLIATVEKADALMRYLGPLLLRRLRLLIVDEAHQVVPEDNERTQADFAEHSNRSIRLEGFVSRLLAQSPDIVRIALTAVAGGAASPVARWIEGREDAQAVGTRYRSTRQIVGVFETAYGSSGRMLLELMNGRPLFVRGRDEPVYLRLGTPPMPDLSAAMRHSIYRFNELDVLWTALHLIDDDRRILISVAQQPEKTMGWYKDALELESWQDALTFEPPEDDEGRARFDETRAACIDYCGEDSYELALLDQGIATNHGQMPQRLRRLMTDLIDRGICPITVATATLTEGVNLPFDIIFLTALKRRTYDPVNNTPVETPMSAAEFRNLSGRAGRPGASNGMEGITLVAIPRRPASTAPKQIPLQRRQIRALRDDYDALRRRLLAEELEQAEVDSPLALLLQSIADRVRDLLGLQGDAFLEWLEAAIPPDISDEAGRAETSEESRLADSVDELDGILLSAIEEIERLRAEGLEGAAAEDALMQLWRRTFSAYAAAQEEWLERAFVRRGRAIIDDIYPDAEERSRLYQYGFTPYVGRRFEAIAPDMRAVIEAAQDYGSATAEDRLAVFVALGELIAADRGYGFRVRATETDRTLLENWQGVLGWWVLAPEAASPDPSRLRAWQRFVADNIEFRLGVAVGAVVARAWSDGAGDPLTVPSLDAWRETTGLPWFGFWARELLRWGTLDPFVAFALSQGLAQTREAATARREEYETWLDAEYDDLDGEDFIDPQLFLAWERSLPQPERAAGRGNRVPAELTGTTGERGRYRVVPILRDERICWIDAAGYVLAESNREESPFRGRLHRQDFELRTNGEAPFVERSFGG